MIKALLFDIDGVITHFDFAEVYTAVENELGLKIGAISQYFSLHLDELLVGTLSPHDTLRALDIHPSTTPEEFFDVWTQEIATRRTVDMELLAVIKSLRENYTVAALSNLTETRYYADRAADLYEHFDDVFLSCVEGCMKPDPDFFRCALARLDVAPAETIFIDDNPRFVEAAKPLGLHAIHFKDRNQLLTEFSQYGISV